MSTIRRLGGAESLGVTFFCASAILVFLSPVVWGQGRQVTTGAPFHSVNDSFFERIGFGGSFRGPGFQVNLGSFPLAVPPFGGFQPGAGATGGFAINGGGFQGNVAFEFSQGSRRSNVMQAPMVTMMDGQEGIFSDVTQSPFVISGLPWKNHPDIRVPFRRPEEPAATATPEKTTPGEQIARQAAAGGDRPLASVAEIRRQRQAADEAKAEQARTLFARGEQAEKEGKLSVAKIYYQMAARDAPEELRQQILDRLKNLGQTK
jgi:hypothetical protein